MLTLMASLILPLVYLPQAPSPVGTGLLRVFGWGALVGVGLGALVCTAHRPLADAGTRGGKLAALIGVVSMGVCGGAAGGALLDQSRVIATTKFELPIVKVERLSGRRRYSLQIATLSPLDPTGPDHVAATAIDGDRVREGECLIGIVERGLLGGAWVKRYRAGTCSIARGSAGSHVIVTGDDFSSWRWHRPRSIRLERATRAWDEGLPAGLTCRVRSGAWLYRCSPR